MNHYEIQEYIMRHRPAAAYLGRLEMKAMVAEAERNRYVVPMIPEPDLRRMEFCGCPLFEVDSESHVGFGQNAEPMRGENGTNLK